MAHVDETCQKSDATSWLWPLATSRLLAAGFVGDTVSPVGVGFAGGLAGLCCAKAGWSFVAGVLMSGVRRRVGFMYRRSEPF